MNESMVTGVVIFVLGMIVGAVWNATVWRRYHAEEMKKLSRRYQKSTIKKQIGGKQFTLNGKFVNTNDFIDANDLTEDELDQIAGMNVKDEKTFDSATAGRSVLKRII